MFSPIAIIGRGCVLPDAFSPEALWDIVLAGRVTLSRLPDAQWRLGPGINRERLARAVASEYGGYVREFERVFDPRGYDLDTDGLDPVFLWTLHASREALRSAGIEDGTTHPKGVVVLGNLSYPVPGLVDLAIETWAGEPKKADPRNRFMSGLPAQLTARALRFGLSGFALDAACASSLYAIKLACDRLQDRTAELALAGGVNHTESLFLHLGFTALGAESPTGRSRPFHRHADGLVAAHGAAMLVLKRLEDAERAGDRILGVIRGIGLSNDGRGRGILVPSEEGQVRAMQAAYAVSGLCPRDISLVECHATGTPVGDVTELRSMRRVFHGATDVPIGSLKSNLGHLITASGGAALLKVLGAFEAGIRPPSVNADEPLEELESGPFRVLQSAEAWQCDGLRRAAISNFGFGGNNAHLLVEEWRGAGRFERVGPTGLAEQAAQRAAVEPVAVVARTVSLGPWQGAEQFAAGLLSQTDSLDGTSSGNATPSFQLDLARLRFPPTDLKESLPQQTLMLNAAQELEPVLTKLPPTRTGLLVGMQCDAEISRFSVRWRHAELHAPLPGAADDPKADPGDRALTAAMVLGCMPNIVANRLGRHFDFHQPTFTVSADEASGTVALELAMRSLRHHEIDAAVVGAVDLCAEPVHASAASRLLPAERQRSADAAVLMVLKRLSDAQRDGDPILATLGAPDLEEPAADLSLTPYQAGVSSLTGHSHAASGLVQVAAAITSSQYRAHPRQPGRPAMPILPSAGQRQIRVQVEALGGMRTELAVRGFPSSIPPRGLDSTRLAVFGAEDMDGLLRALRSGTRGSSRALRVAIVAQGDEQLEARIARAGELLRTCRESTCSKLEDGIYFGSGEMQGELAFVFTGPGGAYSRMGRELALALPELVDALGGRMATLREAAGWLYEQDASYRPLPVEKLWGASFLTQLHAELTRGLLGIRPQATIGYCSGETNALFAMGAWSDLDSFRKDIDEFGVYSRELCRELRCVRKAWQVPEGQPVDWITLRARAPIEEVRRLVAAEPRVHLTIVNSPTDMVIAGDPEGCARVTQQLGAHRVSHPDYDFVMHCPEAREYATRWYELHHRPTATVPGVRFYTHSTLSAYSPTADSAARALTGQAMNPVDFPELVRQAWADGVRIFVEHGPHGGCTRWIQEALANRPHLAVALDRYGRSSMLEAAESIAHLVAAGVPMEHQKLEARLCPNPASTVGLSARDATTSTPGSSSGKPAPSIWLELPSHLAPVRLSPERDRLPAASTQAAPSALAVNHLPAVLANDAAETPSADLMPAAPQSITNTIFSAERLPDALGQDSGWTLAPEDDLVQVMEPAPGLSRGPVREMPPAIPWAEQLPLGGETASSQPRPPGPPASGMSSAPAYPPGLEVLLGMQADMHREFLRHQFANHALFMRMAFELVRRSSPETHAVPLLALQPQADAVARDQRPTTQSSGPGSEASRPALETSRPPSVPATHLEQDPAGPGEQPAREATRPSQAVALPAAPALNPARSPSPNRPRPTGPRTPTGPRFNRGQLEVLASGQISSVFGPLFERQDGYDRQVRMPEPPLLLADRVLGIEGEPGTLGLGTIWTETDIREDAWYLHENRMPAGILVESGQADLLLISWLGIDFFNRGERVYRLLGCELTPLGELPKAGDTLTYQIQVDGHAQQGDVRLFFFHYDCWVNGELRVTVRNGQAGFFTDQELAESAGILWSPSDGPSTADGTARLEASAISCTKRRFSASDLDAFIAGDGLTCFGPGFERLASHTLSPCIQGGRMRLLDEVTDFDPAGGPWGRGYLRARLALKPDHWFFQGHFKNDQCMPGTLMFEGSLQALSLYLVALGYTTAHDGWRFEPVSEVAYPLRCRGQALPSNKEVVYEVFVDEIIAGPYPTIYADLLGTVDGLKAFHCRRMGLRLVPAWPMDVGRLPIPLSPDVVPVATAGDFPFGYRSLMACALGRPSEAFGAMYHPFDGSRHVARLPGPPYHFMTYVARVEGPIGGLQVGSMAEVVYDVPQDAWYFESGPKRVMPFAVLLEVALQPCGWLASYVGCATTTERDLVFRNLDGSGTVHCEVDDRIGPITTRTKLTSLSSAGGILIVSFEVSLRAGERPIFTFNTVFGFFPLETMKNQIGLPVTPEMRAGLLAVGQTFQLSRPRSGADSIEGNPPRCDGRFLEGPMRLPAAPLLMIDRITGLWPEGGAAGLGRIRAVKDIDPREWFFKAHFFQDPVQPGSLGLEAILQALQALMLEKRLGDGLEAPSFEPIASKVPITWKYRGQVVPENRQVVVDVEILELREDDRGRVATAAGSLWVDGKRIYEARGMGLRIVSGQRSATFDRAVARQFWRGVTLASGGWAGEDLLFALLDRFVGNVRVVDPTALGERAGKGMIFVANHQVAVETILAAIVLGGMTGTVPILPAKAEHQHTWVGQLLQRLTARPGIRDPLLLRFIDRTDPTSVLRMRESLREELRQGRSVLIHAEGTRSTSCRHPVTVMSAVFLDLALEAGVDIVPVRLVGGLPVHPLESRLDFPVGYGKQELWIGRPITPQALEALHYSGRKARVLEDLNALGVAPEDEVPAPPDLTLEAAVMKWKDARGVSEAQAALAVTLSQLEDPSEDGRALLAALQTGKIVPGDGPLAQWRSSLAAWLLGGASPVPENGTQSHA